MTLSTMGFHKDSVVKAWLEKSNYVELYSSHKLKRIKEQKNEVHNMPS